MFQALMYDLFLFLNTPCFPMNECVALCEEEPRQCLEAWAASPGAYAAQLDARCGVDPHCGTCLFGLCACVPCCPLAPCVAAAVHGASRDACVIFCCLPWLVGYLSSREVAGDDLV